MRPAHVAVMGAGSWGTAFAKVLADAGCAVTLHARRPELVAAIAATRQNADYLPGVRLPDAVRATGRMTASVVSARRATPVRASIGHQSGSRVTEPSG